MLIFFCKFMLHLFFVVHLLKFVLGCRFLLQSGRTDGSSANRRWTLRGNRSRPGIHFEANSARKHYIVEGCDKRKERRVACQGNDRNHRPGG